jgi:hypothetical protein
LVRGLLRLQALPLEPVRGRLQVAVQGRVLLQLLVQLAGLVRALVWLLEKVQPPARLAQLELEQAWLLVQKARRQGAQV